MSGFSETLPAPSPVTAQRVPSREVFRHRCKGQRGFCTALPRPQSNSGCAHEAYAAVRGASGLLCPRRSADPSVHAAPRGTETGRQSGKRFNSVPAGVSGDIYIRHRPPYSATAHLRGFFFVVVFKTDMFTQSLPERNFIRVARSDYQPQINFRIFPQLSLLM